jgi:hypothetical protein
MPRPLRGFLGRSVLATVFALAVTLCSAAGLVTVVHALPASWAHESAAGGRHPVRQPRHGATVVGRLAVIATNPYAGRVGMAVSHDLWALPESQIRAEFQQLRAGGITWVREDLSWAVLQPRRGVFNWAPFDSLMTAAAQAGVQVLGILDYSTPWASSDPSGTGDILYPPKNNADFAAYAAAVAARYGTGGGFWSANPSLAPDALTAVEIWNEPFGSWFWKPGPDPAAYAALVSATAPAIHAVSPGMTVLMSGELWSWDNRNGATGTQMQPWITRVLAANPRLATLVNGIDVHPYSTPRNLGPYDTAPNAAMSFSRVPMVRAAELRAGANLPIWITEIGWSTATRYQWGISEQAQATDVKGAVQRAIGEWGSYVSKVFVFGWYRSSGVSGDSEDNYGLLESNGVPKPAWTTITQLLGGANASQPCPLCSSQT